MKKIVTLTLILVVLMMSLMIGTVSAALTCEVSLETAKTKYAEEDEIAVDIKVSDIKSNNGVASFSATLEYDKDSLTFVKAEGKNDWTKPTYNKTNGKITTDINKDKPVENDEVIARITFKVNKGSKQNLSITLKDISVSNIVDNPVKIDSVTKKITIEKGATSQLQIIDDGSKTNSETEKEPVKDNTNASEEIPQTGVFSNIWLPLFIIAFVVIASRSGMKLVKLNENK